MSGKNFNDTHMIYPYDDTLGYNNIYLERFKAIIALLSPGEIPS